MSTPSDLKHDRVMKFYTELATITQQAKQGQSALQQAAAQRELAKKDADTAAQKQIDVQAANVERVTKIAVTAATEKAKREDLHGVQSLLEQIQARLKNHAELVTGLHEMEAQFELAVAMGEFEEGKGGMSRADAEQQIAHVRARVEKQLALVDAMVPSPGIVLL